MADYSYDIAKLESTGEIDVKIATESLSNSQAYFDELDKFIAESKHYLQGYTASVVIYNEDMRNGFLKETEEVKRKLVSLGLSELADSVSELADASDCGSAETLSDWILRFHAQVDNTVKLILSARVKKAPAKTEPSNQVILAVDDKPELLTAIVEILSDSYKVIAVTSGSAALNVIKKYTPELFLLDIEMPGMNGYDVARAIRGREDFQKTPIIFLTGKNTRGDVVKAVQNGGNDYLLKPVEKGLLLDKIKYYLG